MTTIKITHKTLMVNLEFPIEVGQVKLNAECQSFISQNNDTGELEGDFVFLDYGKVTYMGMPIDGYNGMKKLKTFHKELGIDLDALIDNEYNKVITSDFQKIFISTFDKGLFKI